MDNLLKYGAIGLSLALSILVYHLIRDFSKRDKISKHTYYLLYSFMGFVIIVMFTWIAVELYKGDNLKQKKNIEQYKWTTYSRNGYSIQLPDIFHERDITNMVQYYKSDVNTDIVLKIDCNLSKQRINSSTFQQLYNQKITENNDVVYQIYKNNFFVISGNKGNKKYYYKGLLKNTSFYLMSIEYPSRYQYIFDEVMTTISRSFK